MPSPLAVLRPESLIDSPGQVCRALARCKPCQQTPCQLSAVAGEDFWWANLENLSSGGAGLILSDPLDVGGFLFIELTNAAHIYTRTLLSRITHVTSRPDKTFLVGVEFTSELNPEELRLLLA